MDTITSITIYKYDKEDNLIIQNQNGKDVVTFPMKFDKIGNIIERKRIFDGKLLEIVTTEYIYY